MEIVMVDDLTGGGGAYCKVCERNFGSPSVLLRHWDYEHKHRTCDNCDKPRRHDINHRFCQECSEIETSLLGKIRAAENDLISAQREQDMAHAIVIEKQQVITALNREYRIKNDTAGRVYCGHGLLIDQCLPCFRDKIGTFDPAILVKYRSAENFNKKAKPKKPEKPVRYIILPDEDDDVF